MQEKMSFIYKRKFYRNFFIRKFIRISWKLSELFDGLKDRRICGCSLVKYVPSLYREKMGATGSQSTSYWVLDKIFRNEVLNEDDRFIDVGCGKGRVLAYLIRKKCPCLIEGVELNPEVAEYARKWAAKYKNINIISGSAFDIDYNKYTKLFMGRPFEPEMFHNFIGKLESELVHPVRLYYWVDQQSGGYLENRKGWRMLRRENAFISHSFFICSTPQRYSVWEYEP